MYMETQTTVCIPSVNGITVHASTQFPDMTNIAIAECLKLPTNSIRIEVKSVGGGFGGKESRPAQIACACALATHLTGQPIRFVMSLESNMNVVGKRNAMIAQYAANVDRNGKIVELTAKMFLDMGCSLNESPRFLVGNCYDASSWSVTRELIKTNAPSMTWCRGPGTLESISMAEVIMEHIAKVMDKDPVAVRIANMAPDSKMKTLIPDFLKDVGKYT